MATETQIKKRVADLKKYDQRLLQNDRTAHI